MPLYFCGLCFRDYRFYTKRIPRRYVTEDRTTRIYFVHMMSKTKEVTEDRITWLFGFGPGFFGFGLRVRFFMLEQNKNYCCWQAICDESKEIRLWWFFLKARRCPRSVSLTGGIRGEAYRIYHSPGLFFYIDRRNHLRVHWASLLWRSSSPTCLYLLPVRDGCQCCSIPLTAFFWHTLISLMSIILSSISRIFSMTRSMPGHLDYFSAHS